jgi:hypothetical protein
MPDISRVKDYAATIQSILASIAIIVAGTWAVLQFHWHREAYPHLALDQLVQHRALPHKRVLLTVDLSIKNESKVFLDRISGHVVVDQILPLTSEANALISKERDTYAARGKRGIDWGDRIGERLETGSRFLEPGDIDVLHYEFIVSDVVCTVGVTSFIENPKLPLGGWERTTLHDVRSPENCHKRM